MVGEGPEARVHRSEGADAHGPATPGARTPADPVEALIDETRSRGADPDFYTAGARWKREADIPDDVYFRAKEAIG